jgi:hypothetical protein
MPKKSLNPSGAPRGNPMASSSAKKMPSPPMRVGKLRPNLRKGA